MTTTTPPDIDDIVATFRSLLIRQTSPEQFVDSFGIRVVLVEAEYDRGEAVRYFSYWLRRVFALGRMTESRRSELDFARTRLREMGIVVVWEGANGG